MGRRSDTLEECLQSDNILASSGDFQECTVEGRKGAEGAGGGSKGGSEGGLEVGLQGRKEQNRLEILRVVGSRDGGEEVKG